MKKVCIICPYDYPIPAVKGGAVETLIDFLIDENEEKSRFKFTVLTTFCKTIPNDRNYSNTSFLYFNKVPLIDNALFLLFRILKKYFGIYIPQSVRFWRILNYLRNHPEFDYILDEYAFTAPIINRVYPKEKILSHLHWDGAPTVKADCSIGYLLPVSNYIANNWMAATSRSKESVYVWKNCCNMKEARNELSKESIIRLKSSLRIDEDSFVILYVGRIAEEKGIDYLLEAIDRIDVEEIKIHLVMIGAGHFGNKKITQYEKRVYKRINEAKQRISALGYIHNEELFRYYGIADIVVMPSVANESAGIVNIEAMRAEVPVITTNAGAIEEYVGDAAYIVDKDGSLIDEIVNGIKYLYFNPGERERMREAGKLRAEEYTPAVYYERFYEIVSDIDNLKFGKDLES